MGVPIRNSPAGTYTYTAPSRGLTAEIILVAASACMEVKPSCAAELGAFAIEAASASACAVAVACTCAVAWAAAVASATTCTVALACACNVALATAVACETACAVKVGAAMAVALAERRKISSTVGKKYKS